MLWLHIGSTLLQLTFLMQDGTSAASDDKASPAKGETAESASETATKTPDAATPAVASPEAGKAASDAAKPAPGGDIPYMQFLPILIIGFFFYIILLRPQQREQRRRQELLGALKKNDKVVTTGGLIGTIADLSADGKMVTLRVDDTTRIKFLRSAIHGPLDDKPESTTSASS